MDQTAQENQETQPPFVAKLVLAIAAIVALIVLVGLVIYGQGRAKKAQVEPTSSATAVPNPSVAPPLTYQNETYGFSLRYVDIWELAETTAEPILDAKAALGFTFKNTLPQATFSAGPNLPKLVIYVFEFNPDLGNFAKVISQDKDVVVGSCPGGLSDCKTLTSKNPGEPFAVQIVRQGRSFTYGFAMFDENQQPASLERTPAPLGAVVANFFSE